MLKRSKKTIIHIMIMLIVTLLSFYFRYYFRYFESGDYRYYLSIWYDVIKEYGGLNALKIQVGNYNVIYQFFIALLTYLPIKKLFAYKLSSGIFDYGLAIIVYLIVNHFTNNKTKSMIAYCLVTLSPIVILNSAAWAQCDSIYTFFVMCCILMLCKDKWYMAAVFCGIALSFKLQTILIFPFILYYCIIQKKRLWQIMSYGLTVIAMLFVSGLPALIAGRNILDVIAIYFEQTVEYNIPYLNYPSFWMVLFEPCQLTNFKPFQIFAIMVMIVLILMACVVFYKYRNNEKHMLYSSFILTYITVLFMPAMHERYGYIYEILAVIIAVISVRTTYHCILLYCLTVLTYLLCFNGYLLSGPIYGFINTILCLLYCMYFIKDMKKEKDIALKTQEIKD